jgi:hypothetical protein
MLKYQGWLPEQSRIIEADSEDEAQELFMMRDDIFDFLKIDPVDESETSE